MFPDFTKISEMLEGINPEKIKDELQNASAKIMVELEATRVELQRLVEAVEAVSAAQQLYSFVSLLPLYVSGDREYNAEGHLKFFQFILENFNKIEETNKTDG